MFAVSLENFLFPRAWICGIMRKQITLYYGELYMRSDKVNVSEQIGQTVFTVETLLGNQIAGLYLYGSAALAGLQPNSDIDILVITNDEMPDSVRSKLTEQIKNISGVIGDSQKRPLEITVVNQKDIIPWRFPPKWEYMYGEWLRNEIEAGKIPQPCYDADLVILLWQARAHSVVLRGKAAKELIPFIPDSEVRKAIKNSLPGLLASIKGDERNVLLTLCRMWFTLETAEICPKNIAAEWVLPELPNELVPILELAINGYLGNCVDEWTGLEKETRLLADFLNRNLERILNSSE